MDWYIKIWSEPWNYIFTELIPDTAASDHDDVIEWKHFPRYWPFVRGIHRWPVDSPHKGQWRGALVFSLISAWTNGRANNLGDAGDLRRHRAHYDFTVMTPEYPRNFLQHKLWNWESGNIWGLWTVFILIFIQYTIQYIEWCTTFYLYDDNKILQNNKMWTYNIMYHPH